MQFRTTSRKIPVTLLALSIGPALSGHAAAQEAAQSPAEPAVDLDTVTVSGYRASVEKALDIKRGDAGVVDAIVAEDIGKFPDLNLADSVSFLP
ncbi:TonB-dependent receptor [Xanthomonas oryzae pv. oryzae]|nr:TonB-dependent receptor [Xanthomonas oryzae pv. oryzae]RBI29517.1 TonB-dependent receptor [Xanthomonas oryzae pv. oryzae]